MYVKFRGCIWVIPSEWFQRGLGCKIVGMGIPQVFVEGFASCLLWVRVSFQLCFTRFGGGSLQRPLGSGWVLVGETSKKCYTVWGVSLSLFFSGAGVCGGHPNQPPLLFLCGIAWNDQHCANYRRIASAGTHAFKCRRWCFADSNSFRPACIVYLNHLGFCHCWRIIPHRIHGHGIFPYMKIIQVNHSYR